jgi:hypothetical protein
MRPYRYGLAAAIIVAVAGSASGRTFDFGKTTCHEFLASGQTNMAPIIMWLRGYHAGKNGTTPFDGGSPYAARLGFYCRSHPDDNLLDTSERILSDLDRGI